MAGLTLHFLAAHWPLAAAALNALDNYMAGAKAAAAIDANREKTHADTIAERDRTIADLRAGRLKLRDTWTCPALPAGAAAGTSGSRDEEAQRGREAGAADVQAVGREADGDLAACQAQVNLYQRIGVLRVDPPR